MGKSKKAFLDGLNTEEGKEGLQLEAFIYKFTKLLGTHGVPEYGLGVVKFSDFLQIQIKKANSNAVYYQNCQAVTLDRQIGSRYFVSASNAGQVLLLADATNEFLHFTGSYSAFNSV